MKPVSGGRLSVHGPRSPPAGMRGTEQMEITVLIVDDDPVAIAALRARVNRIPGFRVVSVAHTGRAALAAACRFAPNLVLLDLHLPDLPGLEVARQLRRPDQPSADVI